MDKYELALEDKLKEIKECQDSIDTNTCSRCNEYWSCILRTSYVRAVYQSMSKDKEGNFEF